MPLLTLRDDESRYVIDVPSIYEIRLLPHQRAVILVPCPFGEDEPMELTDEFLIAAARDGDFGLELVHDEMISGAKQDVEHSQDTMSPP